MHFQSVSTKAGFVFLCLTWGVPSLVQATPAPSVWIAQRPDEVPQIDSFSVQSVKQLLPGTELIFILLGTPNAKATMTISGVVTNMPMQQTEPGVYQSRYTVRSQDTIGKNTVIRANLVQGDRVSSVRLDQPLVASETPTNPGASSTALQIKSFTVQPSTPVEPGGTLEFILEGTPSAKAVYSIDGVFKDRPLLEASAGVYRDRYVVRLQDSVPATGANVAASLQLGDQVLRTQLIHKLVVKTTTPEQKLFLDVLSPADNSKVGESIEVKGRSLPDTVVKVTIQAQNSLAGIVGLNRTVVDQQEVKTDGQGNFSFAVRPSLLPIAGTRYTVKLTAARGTETQEKALTLIQR